MKFQTLQFQIARLCLVIATFVLASTANARRCDLLFREADSHATQQLLDPSWTQTAETEYNAMLVELKVARKPGEPPAELSAGTIVYSYWKRHPDIDNQLLKVGFSVNDSAERFGFPASFSDLIRNIQSQNTAGTFKVATYNTKNWYRLDEVKPDQAVTEVATDLPFLTYASMVAEGYTPLWPGRTSLGLLHDLAHVTEYIEHPAVFPALQKFFKHFLLESTRLNSNSPTQMRYAQRAKFFNEVSYILKPSRYASVDLLLVTEGADLGSVPVHYKQLRQALEKDTWGTLEKIRVLANAFDDLFFRHGGGARDVYAIDTRLSQEIIEAYVNATKADPAAATSGTTFPEAFLAEFAESPEGLKRQIQYVAKRLETDRSSAPLNHLAYRVAQLEVAILTQRRLELSQVDVIEDSMLPVGADSKTSRYFQAYLPPSSKLNQLYNSKASEAR